MSLPAVLTAWCELSRSLSLLPRKKKGAWEVGKRGQRGWLPLGLCAATSLGLMIRGLAAHCPRGLGAPLPT